MNDAAAGNGTATAGIASGQGRRWLRRPRQVAREAGAENRTAVPSPRESAAPQVAFITMHEPAASVDSAPTSVPVAPAATAGGGGRRRRLRWAGWISGGVFHG